MYLETTAYNKPEIHEPTYFEDVYNIEKNQCSGGN